MQDLYKIDREINKFSREIDFYSYLTPLNQEEEREKFFAGARKGVPYSPVFNYRKKDFAAAREKLTRMRTVMDECDDLESLFAKRLDFMLEQLELLEADDGSFGGLSGKLYGVPDKECLLEAEKILMEMKNKKYAFPEESLSPVKVASILRKELAIKGIAWRCVLSEKIVPKVTISGKDKTIYINAHVNYTEEEIGRLKVHEIKVHVYRGANGDLQPFKIFREGLAGYDETEEGLAVAAEKAMGCYAVDTRQLKLYAGRALCVDYCREGSFAEVFARLREFFPDDLAYRLTGRGKRGLKDTSCKGGFTRDYHYISGLRKINEYVEEKKDLSILYVGKIGLSDVEAVERLIDKGVLRPPRYLPEFI